MAVDHFLQQQRMCTLGKRHAIKRRYGSNAAKKDLHAAAAQHAAELFDVKYMMGRAACHATNLCSCI